MILEGRYDEAVQGLKEAIEAELPTSQSHLSAGMLKKLGERLIQVGRDQEAIGAWRIECFDRVRILRPGREIQNIHWKRKKAEELFIYLLLQPNYRAPKDAAAELLFYHEDTEQMFNQLYVAVHQIKRTLSAYLEVSNGILIKNGMIQLREEMIDHVDVEKYQTLIRVGNQLWPTHPDLSCELFDEAQQMYGELAPTLRYIDWLDQFRMSLLRSQTEILKRLGSYAVSIGSFERAELYYLEWIRLSPFEEEAYQELLRVLITMNRAGAAKLWFQKMEHLFRSELGITPMDETARIISEGFR